MCLRTVLIWSMVAGTVINSLLMFDNLKYLYAPAGIAIKEEPPPEIRAITSVLASAFLSKSIICRAPLNPSSFGVGMVGRKEFDSL
jgi:hypothetical protein